MRLKSEHILMSIVAAGQGIFTILFALIVFIFNSVKDEVKLASVSVQELNNKLAVVITRIEYQDKTINEYNERIRRIEELKNENKSRKRSQ
ncbi:MAG: hypothetical protein IPL34_20265 [Thiofilum sp.]|uniref:hypothetical protein n=1 Tax=Thiofilum sp. TaxID=2212733 RepID=UPI0025CF5C65|nr:hypothetical protein [Thiofilum sp.]MBK8455617.1 hypothetical protein [Thiofilum sp.]